MFTKNKTTFFVEEGTKELAYFLDRFSEQSRSYTNLKKKRVS